MQTIILTAVQWSSIWCVVYLDDAITVLYPSLLGSAPWNTHIKHALNIPSKHTSIGDLHLQCVSKCPGTQVYNVKFQRKLHCYSIIISLELSVTQTVGYRQTNIRMNKQGQISPPPLRVGGLKNNNIQCEVNMEIPKGRIYQWGTDNNIDLIKLFSKIQINLENSTCPGPAKIIRVTRTLSFSLVFSFKKS